jgi:hypothetical protein
MGGEPESLLQAFIKTANEYHGSTMRLDQYLQIIEEIVEKGELHFQLDNLRSLIKEMKSSGYPALHHSPQYEAAYKPSYRVIARQFLPQNLK